MSRCFCSIDDLRNDRVTLFKSRIKNMISKQSGFSSKQRRFINKMNKLDLFLFVNLRDKEGEPYKYNFMRKKQLLSSLRFPVV